MTSNVGKLSANLNVAMHGEKYVDWFVIICRAAVCDQRLMHFYDSIAFDTVLVKHEYIILVHSSKLTPDRPSYNTNSTLNSTEIKLRRCQAADDDGSVVRIVSRVGAVAVLTARITW